jgi:hypothetical protein
MLRNKFTQRGENTLTKKTWKVDVKNVRPKYME